jgi:hypothetical protein
MIVGAAGLHSEKPIRRFPAAITEPGFGGALLYIIRHKLIIPNWAFLSPSVALYRKSKAAFSDNRLSLRSRRIRSIMTYGEFMRILSAANRQRKADAIRAARSEAYHAARCLQGCTDESAIAAANAAEVELRRQAGITEPLDTSQPAAPYPWFPSDVRSIDHWHPNE